MALKTEHKNKIDTDFKKSEILAVLDELSRLTPADTMDGDNNLNNTISAILQLSKGNVAELTRLVEAAKTDFRDVIYWASLEDKRMKQGFDICLTGRSVTPDSLFLISKVDPEYNPKDLIAKTENRLSIVLPNELKALYQIQNGGHINNVCVPIKDGSEFLYEEVLFPFSGYNDLNPLERLRTLKDSISDYACADDPEQASEFPEGCDNMIILARWYDHTLFLDYNHNTVPRVGFVNFGKEDWPSKGHSWKSFGEFFQALKHYEE